MREFAVSLCLAVAVCGGLRPSVTVGAEARKADQILREINAVESPEFNPARQGDETYVKAFVARQEKAMTRKAELIGELYKVDPKHKALGELLPERWMVLMKSGPGKAATLRSELADVQHHSEDASLRSDAAFYNAALELQAEPVKTADAVKAADAFIRAYPKDERGAALIYAIADQADDAEQAELLRRLEHDYPGSQYAKMAEGSLKRLQKVGKPFRLDFKDAIKGTEVSMAALKGKVVVVDFWATWCGPCVAEMPHMKTLYAQYKDKGVEFIGVSLDKSREEGGLDKLKAFVTENEIAWPQYYQGDYWQSEFSRSWDINSIPSVFIVDANGNLASVNARGKLDRLIPDLLKKAKANAGVASGAGGQ